MCYSISSVLRFERPSYLVKIYKTKLLVLDLYKSTLVTKGKYESIYLERVISYKLMFESH